MNLRIGQGYDVHRLKKGRPMILGGVRIPCEFGPDGHSDADVLLHAVMDALLGAANLGDIGALFPDSDEKYRNADSLELLRIAADRIRSLNAEIVNIDATLILQHPKVAPYITEMCGRIAVASGISRDRVSVKATTEEGLGFTGTGEGVAALAVALISR